MGEGGENLHGSSCSQASGSGIAAPEFSHSAVLYSSETANVFFYDFTFLIKFNFIHLMKELYLQPHTLPKCLCKLRVAFLPRPRLSPAVSLLEGYLGGMDGAKRGSVAGRW